MPCLDKQISSDLHSGGTWFKFWSQRPAVQTDVLCGFPVSPGKCKVNTLKYTKTAHILCTTHS